MSEKSLAEIYGLTENDPWRNPTEDQLLREQKQKALYETAINKPPPLEFVFTDPEDNDDLTVAKKNSQDLFWRVMVPGKRLIEIVDLDPYVHKLVLAYGNTTTGCWLAYTSRRVAIKFSNLLTGQSIAHDLHSCDIGGNMTEKAQTSPPEGWRPWHPVGDPSEMKAGEFFYCIIEQDDRMYIRFVPVIFWSQNATIYEGPLGIEKMVEPHLAPTVFHYLFMSRRDMHTVKPFLDSQGFRENLVFQAYVNDQLR
jgi:hypothetical protein